MPFEQLARIIFPLGTPIRAVLERFNETAIHTEQSGFALVVDAEGRCIGVVTDGDVRRKLVRDVNIDEPIESAMNNHFVYTRPGDSYHKVLRCFDHRVTNVPVLDGEGRPVDLYRYSRFKASARVEPRIIRARVPARVSFSGGGTDMSYYINRTPTAVLSSTINRYCIASVLVRGDRGIHIVSKDLGLSYEASEIDHLEYGDELDLIKSSVKVMQPEFGFDLETFAEFEPGTGLGGSSAISVAVIGALNYFRNENQLGLYHVADLAYQAERIELGIEGGWQDQYATAFGGFNWLEFRQNEVVVNPLRIHREVYLELEYNLMLFRVGETRNSGTIHSGRLADFDRDKGRRARQFSQMSKMAVEMKEALLKGRVKQFGDLLHASWQLKQKLGENITNREIDSYYSMARKLGALGGKLLGAGQGGHLLIYASPVYQRSIQENFEEKGAILERFKFTENGLEVWSTPR